MAVTTAEVRASVDLDRLVVTSRPGDERAVRAALAAAGVAPGPRREGAAASIVGLDARVLADRRLDGVDLRMDDDAARYAHNRRLAVTQYDGLRRHVETIRDGSVAAARAMLTGGDELDRLDGHQVRNVAAMSLPECFGLCLFDEQGAGKTVSVIFTWDQLVARREFDRMLVVAPKSMVPEWQADLERFTGGLYRTTLLTGTRRDKQRQLRTEADVYVTNFETVVSLSDDLVALARHRADRTLLIVDESFMVKNLDTDRSRALRRLREWCGRCLVLCGTPAPNSAHDLAGQFALADFGVTFDGTDVPADRAAAHAVVQAVLDHRGVYLRNLKRNVLPDLPTKSFDIVEVPMAPEQRRAYDALAQELRDDVRETDAADFERQRMSFAARRSALLQLCSQPAAILDGYRELPGKLTILDGLLPGLVQNGEKVVVWSFFTRAIDAITSRYASLGVVRYDGTVTDTQDRRRAVAAFQEDSAVCIMVANPAAAGAGLTLTAARTAVYESFSNQAAHYLQSLDRVHRRGQQRDVHYLVLLCKDSIDETEYERLQRKERAAQELLGDAVDEPLTRHGLLAELANIPER